MISFRVIMNCRSSRRNELERQGIRNAALNAWFGDSQAVAKKHCDCVTDDDFADAIRSVGQSGGGLDASDSITDVKNQQKAAFASR